MDQVEVDEFELEPLEAVLEGVLRLLVAVVVVEALGRDEDLVAVEPRRAEGLADLGLVPVGGRRVDVAVAEIERAGDGLSGLGGVDLEGAEPELRDLGAVVQLDVGDLCGRVHSLRRFPGPRCPIMPSRSSRNSIGAR